MLLGRLAANLVDRDGTTTLKTSEPTQHITAKAQDVFHRAQLHFLGVHRSVAIHLQHAPPCCSYGRKPTMIPSLQKLKARTARKEISSNHFKPLETDQQTILRPKLSTKPN